MLKGYNKVFKFTQTRLRSVKYILLNRRDRVIPLLKDKSFILLYNNRRQLFNPQDLRVMI